MAAIHLTATHAAPSPPSSSSSLTAIPSHLLCPPRSLKISHSSSSSSHLLGSSAAAALRSPLAKRRARGLRRSSADTAIHVVSALGKLSEKELVPVPPEPEGLDGKFPAGPGVYGVYGNGGDLHFIGISRNIAASIAGHRKAVPELCCSVKVGRVDETADRTVLTDAWKSWMQEHIEASGRVPPGNDSGNNTWVRRPQKKKPDLRLTPGRHVQLTIPLEELIDRLVKENQVVAFIKGSRSAPQCGFSQRVVGILESHGVDFESVDVLDEEYNGGLRETLKSYSNWPTFPQIFVRGELVGGCDILSAMAEKGELAALLKQ